MGYVSCEACRRRGSLVPEVLVATIEPPREFAVVGEPVFIEAHVCRVKKRGGAESNAVVLSDMLPFIGTIYIG